FLRVRSNAGWRWHTRRVVRSAHFDSNREDQEFSDCDNGNRLLERIAPFYRNNGAARNDRRQGLKPDLRDRFSGRSHRAYSKQSHRTVRTQTQRAFQTPCCFSRRKRTGPVIARRLKIRGIVPDLVVFEYRYQRTSSLCEDEEDAAD